MEWSGKEGLSGGRGGRAGRKESLKQCDKEIIKVRL